MPRERPARIPPASTASATLSMKKYMSAKQVVPVESISMSASCAPMYAVSASSLFSTGQIFFCSHSMSGSSSPRPRSIVIAACPWALTKPGSIAVPPRPSKAASPSSVPAGAIFAISAPSVSTSQRLALSRSASQRTTFL